MALSTALDTLQRTRLASAIRAGLSMFVAGTFVYDNNAFAQQVEEDDSDANEEEAILEEVVVTGFAGALRSSQAIKQSSDVVVDSITAEDMGALPDRSVVEALQRVPGVAINRFAAGRDPDHFSVEGSNVIIRGLTYVKSELNGRETFTANNGRQLSFSDIAPELLAGVDVYKSLSAERLEGGISGTVNLRTRKPFDVQEPMFAFTAEATYSDFTDDTSPSGSMIGSYRWDTSVGEFGILGSLIYSEVTSRADRLQVSNFAERTLYDNGDVVNEDGSANPVKDVWFPRGAVMGTQEFERERTAMSAAFQWRSPDDSLEATAEFIRSEATEAWTERVVEIATDNVAGNGDSRAVPGTSFEFTNNDIFDNGYITGPSGWRDDQWSGDPRTPVNGLQSNNIKRDQDGEYMTEDLSLNLKWFVSRDWALNFDYQHVESEVDVTSNTIWASTFQNAMIDLRGTSLPHVLFTPPSLCTDPPSNECPTYMSAGHERFDDPYNSFWRSAMDHIEDSDGEMDAFQVDASKVFPEIDWLGSLQFGYRYADRDQTARFSTYNWGSMSEIWGNGGPIWLDEEVNGTLPGGWEAFYFKGFMDGKVPNPVGDQGRLFYAGNTVDDYDEAVAFAENIATAWGGSYVSLANRPDAIAGTPFIPGEINPVREKNDAAYIKMTFEKALDNGWDISGNVGLRYTETTRTASGFESYAYQEFTSEEECNAPLPPGQEKTAWCSLDPSVRQDARDFSNGTSVQTDYDLDYDYWLPSVNVLLRTSDEWQFRASYFEGVAPPEFGLTRAYFPINLSTTDQDIEAGGGRPIARISAGNPDLLPVDSENWDITAEWYFADVGQLTFALFYKELNNIRTNDVQRRAFTNNGATFDAIVTTAVNSKDTGKIKGFEIAYQQRYEFGDGWLSGFGLNANYTYVDSSGVPQSTLSETDPDVSAGNQTTIDTSLLPLEGLSENTINIQPFYEYGNWSARIGYSWRDEFLLTVRDVIVPFQPIMNESSGQWDASVFYQINDAFRIGLQGTNLTQEIIRTTAVLNDEQLQGPRSWFLNDRRISLSLRGHF